MYQMLTFLQQLANPQRTSDGKNHHLEEVKLSVWTKLPIQTLKIGGIDLHSEAKTDKKDKV